MESAVVAALGAVFIAILSFLGGRTHQKAQANAVDIQSLIDLSNKVESQAEKIGDTNKRIDKLESKISVMWQYIYNLVEQLRTNGIVPVKPPAELESDPILMKLIKHDTQR